MSSQCLNSSSSATKFWLVSSSIKIDLMVAAVPPSSYLFPPVSSTMINSSSSATKFDLYVPLSKLI